MLDSSAVGLSHPRNSLATQAPSNDASDLGGVEETDRREGVHMPCTNSSGLDAKAPGKCDWTCYNLYSKFCDLGFFPHALDLLPTDTLSLFRHLLVDVIDLERRQLRASASADFTSC